MTLRLTPEQERMLDKLAGADGVSTQEAVVRAIADAASRREHRTLVDHCTAGILREDAELLARLTP